MPFKEKSAWIMILSLIIPSTLYIYTVFAHSQTHGQFPTPTQPQLILYTGVLVFIAILGHIIIAAMQPEDANYPTDEREKKIVHISGNFSSHVLAAGCVTSILTYMFLFDGNLLFYMIFASLILSQIIEYASQIVLFRTQLRNL